MRIPAEILLPYPNEGDRFTDPQGTRPVGDSARLPSDLPEGFPKPRQPLDASPEHDEQAARRQREANNQERRQQDRRKKNMPVTLDTRLVRSRRGSASSISVEI